MESEVLIQKLFWGTPRKDKGRGTRSRQEKSLDGNAGLTQVKGDKKGRMFV